MKCVFNQRKGTILRYLSTPRGKNLGFLHIAVLGQAVNIHIKTAWGGGELA